MHINHPSHILPIVRVSFSLSCIITYLDAVIGARRKVFEGNVRTAIRCRLGQNVNDLGTRCYSSHGWISWLRVEKGCYGQQRLSKNKEWIGMTILCRFEISTGTTGSKAVRMSIERRREVSTGSHVYPSTRKANHCTFFQKARKMS
jgi:hypothetical protein